MNVSSHALLCSVSVLSQGCQISKVKKSSKISQTVVKIRFKKTRFGFTFMNKFIYQKFGEKGADFWNLASKMLNCHPYLVVLFLPLRHLRPFPETDVFLQESPHLRQSSLMCGEGGEKLTTTADLTLSRRRLSLHLPGGEIKGQEQTEAGSCGSGHAFLIPLMYLDVPFAKQDVI